ncbi:MAG: serine/threonine protein kinase [Deltaproteobacteria bacterium]|nr:serine/threonine protein kinase [Deltaproteobacteria bacterium]
MGLRLLPDGERMLLDRYQVIGEIAKGGMGSVLLARIAGAGGFQRFVAIKQLHPHLAQEQDFVEMFLDEARLAARIHHQNVVPILEIGTAEGNYFLVMEYIEGATLARLVSDAAAREQRIPRPVLLRIASDMLSGLHAAHELADDEGRSLGLVHRDCSPQNVLVGLDGCSRLTDFGVARASARLASTREDATKGKLAYLAPEQAQGDQIDRRADLFAAGIIVWELCAGRRLFKSSSDARTMRKVLFEPVPRLREVVSDIERELDELCARALERDPERRFQTGAEMADALERAARAVGSDDEPVATVRSVAAYLSAVLGQEVASQREAVRAWLALSASLPFGPAAGLPSSSLSGGTPSAGPVAAAPTQLDSRPPPEGPGPAAGPPETPSDEELTRPAHPSEVGAEQPEQSITIPVVSRPPVAAPAPALQTRRPAASPRLLKTIIAAAVGLAAGVFLAGRARDASKGAGPGGATVSVSVAAPSVVAPAAAVPASASAAATASADAGAPPRASFERGPLPAPARPALTQAPPSASTGTPSVPASAAPPAPVAPDIDDLSNPYR